MEMWGQNKKSCEKEGNKRVKGGQIKEKQSESTTGGEQILPSSIIQTFVWGSINAEIKFSIKVTNQQYHCLKFLTL